MLFILSSVQKDSDKATFLFSDLVNIKVGKHFHYTWATSKFKGGVLNCDKGSNRQQLPHQLKLCLFINAIMIFIILFINMLDPSINTLLCAIRLSYYSHYS